MAEDVPAAFATDPDVAAVIARIGPCTLRGDDGLEPYHALLRAIAGQQLHGAAARAIFGRLCALGKSGRPDGPPPDPNRLLRLPDEALRGCGLSGSKLVAMRGLAQARLDGIVPSRAEAASLADEALIARLLPLRGIGRWTVEMLLMFSLGRPDIMPVDDFGVREGWRRIRGLDVAPRPRVLREQTAVFSPCRSMLAWYCWRVAEEGRRAAPNPLTA